MSDIPSSLDIAALESAFAKFGTVQSTTEEPVVKHQSKSSEDGENKEESAPEELKNLTVTYATKEMAEEAAKGLNETEVDGVKLKVSWILGLVIIRIT